MVVAVVVAVVEILLKKKLKVRQSGQLKATLS